MATNLFEATQAFINNEPQANVQNAQVQTTTPQTETKETITATKVSKMHEYREHLKTITNGLIDMAKAAGRTDYRTNQLLRECYNLVDEELHTFDEWKELGSNIAKGQHAYLFWGSPIESQSGIRYCPVKFLFARNQLAV